MWVDSNVSSALRPSGACARARQAASMGPAPLGADDLAIRRCRACPRRVCISSAAAPSALCAQLHRRQPRRLAAHDGDARGERAHAARDAVGLAVHDTDAGVVDAERIGADLRDHRLDALADRGDAGDDLDARRRVSTSMRTVSNGPSPLFSTNMATPAPTFSPLRRSLSCSCKLVPVGRFQRLVEQQRIVAGIVDDLRAQRVERRARRASRLCRSDCAGEFRHCRCRPWRRLRRAAVRART